MYKFEEKVYNAIKEEVYTSYMDSLSNGEPIESLRANYLLIRRIDKELETARLVYESKQKEKVKK